MMNKLKKIKKRYIALILVLVIAAGAFLFQKPLAVLAFDLFFIRSGREEADG